MHKRFLKFFISTITLSILFISIPVSGEKGGNDHRAGKGAHHGEKKRNKSESYKNPKNNHDPRFNDRQSAIVHDYFVSRFQGGHCPSGLAKKHNGCTPPGQAKKWRIGYPLPRDVIFYDLPPYLVERLGRPGPGYRYARVAADILLIAVGTGIVIDAIEDLSSM